VTTVDRTELDTEIKADLEFVTDSIDYESIRSKWLDFIHAFTSETSDLPPEIIAAAQAVIDKYHQPGDPDIIISTLFHDDEWPDNVHLDVDGGWWFMMRLSDADPADFAVAGLTFVASGEAYGYYAATDETEHYIHPHDDWEENGARLEAVTLDALVVGQLQGNRIGKQVLNGMDWRPMAVELMTVFARYAGKDTLYLLPAQFNEWYAFAVEDLQRHHEVLQEYFEAVRSGVREPDSEFVKEQRSKQKHLQFRLKHVHQAYDLTAEALGFKRELLSDLYQLSL